MMHYALRITHYAYIGIAFHSNFMDYIQESVLDEHMIQNISKHLRHLRIRKQYRPALVYQPKHGKYVSSKNRSSLKATFYDGEIRTIVQNHLPDNIEIPEYEHIDIIHYSQGQYFKEHTDFVNTFPNSAIQVSILVGLKNAKEGGTSIRVEGEKKTYNASIRKGGVLIFNSLLPHSGECVVGEKELLVFTGYLFPRRIESTRLNTHYCDMVHCLAVQTETYDYYDNDYENESDKHQTSPICYYLYQNNRCIAIYDTHRDVCYRFNTPKHILDMQKEQLLLMKKPSSYKQSFDCSVYPLLKDMLTRKKMEECFHQCKSNQQHNETLFRYEKEFCNGGNDYNVLEIPDMFVRTHCKAFDIAIFNSTYYAFWLEKIMNKLGSANIINIITPFLQM